MDMRDELWLFTGHDGGAENFAIQRMAKFAELVKQMK